MNFWQMSPWKIFLAGGPIMWPILLSSIWALAVVIERLWFLSRIRIDADRFLRSVLEKVKQHKIKEAILDCDATKSPVGQILKAGILKHGHPRQEIKEAIEDAALYEVPLVEKNLNVLATIAHVSPLLGLLGTVTGMVSCFQAIQVKTTSTHPVTPGDLAGGIWEALLTTVFGLVVAIPAFIAYNYLVSRVNSIIQDMERAASGLVNLLTE
jgi:biopolymer transport protein ExbB